MILGLNNCENTTSTNKDSESNLNIKMKITAHRGFAYYKTENTLAAFNNAISIGCDRLETDIQVTSDGYLVAFHDKTLDNLTNGVGKIKNLTLSQVKTITYNDGISKIPLIKEVAEIAVKHHIDITMELKAYRTVSDIAMIINKLKQFNVDKLVLLDSFRLADIEEVKNIDATIRVGVLISKSTNTFSQAMTTLQETPKGSYIGIHHTLANKKDINYAHSQGIDYCVWTPSGMDKYTSYSAMGCDYMISNWNPLKGK